MIDTQVYIGVRSETFSGSVPETWVRPLEISWIEGLVVLAIFRDPQ